MTSLTQPENIENAILLIRGQRVMLDRDSAALYGVATGNLSKAVQRNLERFPADFMFQLTVGEAESLRFHFGSLNAARSRLMIASSRTPVCHRAPQNKAGCSMPPS